MDTLPSSSLSGFKLPTLHHPQSHELHRTKNHRLLQHLPHSISSSTGRKISGPSNKVTTFTGGCNFVNPPLVNPSRAASPLRQSSKPPEFHQKAATGYAVALLDAARCNGLLEAVKKDVTRLSRWLCDEQLRGIISSPRVGTKEKGDILKEIVRKGKFRAQYLAKLVKGLIKKAKVEMLGEVLMEFERIYDELNGSTTAQVLLFSSGGKMEEDQLLGIAKRVQKLSGAAEVKVRQLVDERLPA